MLGTTPGELIRHREEGREAFVQSRVEQAELLSLTGIALYEGKTVVQARTAAIFSKRRFSQTCEVVLTVSPAHLQKYVDH